jgi:hypothetical protein
MCACLPAWLRCCRYALDGLGSFKALMRRDWILMQRNWFLYAFKTLQVLFLGVLTGTLFLKGHLGRHHHSGQHHAAAGPVVLQHRAAHVQQIC